MIEVLLGRFRFKTHDNFVTLATFLLLLPIALNNLKSSR